MWFLGSNLPSSVRIVLSEAVLVLREAVLVLEPTASNLERRPVLFHPHLIPPHLVSAQA
jgi:hypothetical protein